MARTPGRMTRALLAAPVFLYEHRLGWLLGQRFLMLTHRGRRSGRRLRTVLEVVGRDTACREVIVMAGFGRQSGWLLNVEAGGPAEIMSARTAFPAVHRLLEADEAVSVLAEYERRNRWAAPLVRFVLGRLAGWHYNGSPEARRRLVEALPLVAFQPARGSPDGEDGHA